LYQYVQPVVFSKANLSPYPPLLRSETAFCRAGIEVGFGFTGGLPNAIAAPWRAALDIGATPGIVVVGPGLRTVTAHRKAMRRLSCEG